MRSRDILVVGSGAREHALAWKLRQSPEIGRLYVAPGNAGTSAIAENVPIAAIDMSSLVRLVVERDISLTVVGPEAPIALGLCDALRRAGRRVVGPSAAAARLESSKAFAKGVMSRAGVPTADYEVYDDVTCAVNALGRKVFPLVVKADGLAAGKGVTICRNVTEARTAIEGLMLRRAHSSAGERILIEEALSGPEVSLLALVDGERAMPLPLAQDHKRLHDGNHGPNTGGMGAFAPVPFLTWAERQTLLQQTIEPIVAEMAARGTPYRGVLFAGLMLTPAGPRVLEYNCRFGDPETQAIVPLIAGDFLPWLDAVADGELSGCVRLSGKAAAGVVLAAAGYPEEPQVGTPIEGLADTSEDVLIFHAGASRDESGRAVTAGGRVLTVVGLGNTIEEAAECAYAAPVHFQGMQRRGDIGRVPASLCSGSMYRTPSPARNVAITTTAPSRTVPDCQPRQCCCEADALNRTATRRVRPRLAVLSSGQGSNLQALIAACSSGDLDAEIALVVSHEVGSGAVNRARDHGILAIELPLTDRKVPYLRQGHEEDLLALLRAHDLDLIVLAGWMLILSAGFLARCPWPVLNVHPALLPKGTDRPAEPVLRGLHAVRDALTLGLSRTGVSVHLVTPEVDAGPVILREPVPIEPGDTEESLYARIKAVEHRLLPIAIRCILTSTIPGGVHA
ncbi:MAG: phosphoribosylamine--glycine ligase [Chloroflexota bacterium]|nr:phosphoribosylamine--glycine ligase [Chloroflexota bacterium]